MTNREIDLGSLESKVNVLLLNPALPESQRKVLQAAWTDCVESRFTEQIGVTTSGSTGMGLGKLVVLPKSAIWASARAVNQWFQITERDTFFKALPSFHVGGLGILARAWLSGAKVIEFRSAHGKETKWNTHDFIGQLRDSNATIVSLVPTQVFDIVNLGLRAPPGLRAAIVGGGHLAPESRSRALALGWPVFHSYGMSECASMIACARAPGGEEIYPLAHVEIRKSERGLAEIKSSSLLSGWVMLLEHGRAQFQDPKENGWYGSEDNVDIAACGGAIKILGRSQDFLKIGGESVELSDLENIFERIKLQIQFSGDAALVGAPDPRLGHKVVLLTNVRDAQVERLRSAFAAEVAPFAKIRDAYFCEKLPRNDLGKLIRGQALALTLANLSHRLPDSIA